MADLSIADDVVRVITQHGEPVPEAAIAAVNCMVRQSEITTRWPSGMVEWTADIDGYEIKIEFNRAGKVIAASVREPDAD